MMVGHNFISILGESGCGKTTLLRIAAGLIPASSGRVLMDGTPVTKPRRDMGFVFQQSVLLEWRNVLENILLPIEIFKLKVEGMNVDSTVDVFVTGVEVRLDYLRNALNIAHILVAGLLGNFPPGGVNYVFSVFDATGD